MPTTPTKSKSRAPTPAQLEAAELGLDIARRAPASARAIARYLARELPVRDLGMHVSGHGGRGSAWGANCLFNLLGSDLWQDLDPTYGHCDGMVPGKYRKARMFCFDEPEFLVLCATETGDRGTTWMCAPKDPGAGMPDMQACEAFFQRLVMGLCLARPELVAVYADAGVPAIAAFREARLIGTGLTKPSDAPRGPGARL